MLYKITAIFSLTVKLELVNLETNKVYYIKTDVRGYSVGMIIFRGV